MVADLERGIIAALAIPWLLTSTTKTQTEAVNVLAIITARFAACW
jgi:hypothetical protein